MPKRIVSIGVSVAGEDVEYASLRSNLSLLDWDIVIFRPDISEFTRYCSDTYMGKRSLDDDASVAIQEAAKHWRSQLELAINEGKTVFVFLTTPESVYVATGEKSYSGTGRSRTTTRIVSEFSNYRFANVPAGWTKAAGTEMKLDPRATELLGSYWNTFGGKSDYCVLWEKNTATACIHTKSGTRPVGFQLSNPSTGGTLFFLPDLDFQDDSFYEYTGKGGSAVWTDVGLQFGRSLIGELVQVARNATGLSSKSAEPDWAKSGDFELPGEVEARQAILERERKISSIQSEIDEQQRRLSEIVGLRDLLYETGKPLEFSIIRALEVLGFKAANFADGTSEFDVVFTCPEGRLLGEAEGKDSKQINITKLRQLSTNILEDVEREDVVAPAKGVLFGNALRLLNPVDREAFFTDKCITTALATSVALVSTVELFQVARNQLINPSEQFAAAVRRLMLTTNGLVDFGPLLKQVERQASGK
jgi:hypothetical protein